MNSLLFEVALRGSDVKTAQSLQQVSNSLNTTFEDNDLWRAKFNTNYNPEHYHEWWTAKENCKLQEKGGLFQLTVIPPDNESVDFVLYKARYSRSRLVNFSNDYIHYGAGYSSPETVTINLCQKLDQYVIFANKNYDLFQFLSSASSLQEAGEKIRELYKKDEQDFQFVIIDFAVLSLECSIPKKADGEYFANLEHALPKEWYWFLTLYKDDGNEYNQEKLEKFLSSLNPETQW